MEKKKLIVLIGPTAVGKTALSIELAKEFGCEIISGDSMQVYRGMDIGTAKITEQEMEGIPHHLIDIKDPSEPFSAAEFQQIVRNKIDEIHSRGKMPMIVGGTGLYIQAVLYDYQFTETPGDEIFRKKLEQRAQIEGNIGLYEDLKGIDSHSAKNIHPNNVRRVIRALEIYQCTGKTMSEYQESQDSEMLYDTALVGLTMDREMLYQRINHRVELMVQEGLVEEVKRLHEKNLRDVQSIQAIGYKEIYEYLDGNSSFDEALENLKQNSRRYAKRQLTWFRNKMDVQWFDVTNQKDSQKNFRKISDFIAGKIALKSNR
ncbi:tRNA (adenosine(37)-N6)-dimethylallyltransferase MiaA [Falsibacillus pallidus]|uniref:tRNA dimethylallyltransferase n=1 Tax=Falsibacillus pallidus TaxID=493781 RepID=A0A370GVR8_9BACI|nr:tRNA (adenosine(37)-N6)-dimethylallyltransferase MiaA [Falsibacillus pallidus]RDI47360.1 tRNA dimethylallyltransferase [Falsibacillus pallidus]